MQYRTLGRTGLSVSEIGFGGEWISPNDPEHGKALVQRCHELGINIVDCWMADPQIRTNLGEALDGQRKDWIIQGHIGSTWQNGQYMRTREESACRAAWEDLKTRLKTNYIELGMIHYVDSVTDWAECTDVNGGYYQFVQELLQRGEIGHVGLSTHNPEIARLAIESGWIEMIMFSLNPAFDMLPASEDINAMFAEEYDANLGGIDKTRAELYQLAEEAGVGITVMKPFAGGRLLDAARSPFGVALSPIQCIHYCLTRPGVASVMCGYSTVEQIEEAVAYEKSTPEERDYATMLANAPAHSYKGQCTYCGHCAPCPSGIDIAAVNKLYDLATLHDEVPASVQDHYGQMAANADDCIACGECETRCPFDVPVAMRMADARKLFDRQGV